MEAQEAGRDFNLRACLCRLYLGRDRSVCIVLADSSDVQTQETAAA